jgi:predicted nucleic acid-binding protein
MFLLDTDTVIYVLKGHEAVMTNLRRHLREAIRISVISLMELYYGAYKSQRVSINIARVRSLEERIEVLPLGKEIAEVFGIQKTKLEKAGTRLDDFDLLLACTALSRNLIMVTNNVRHFQRIEGLKLDNWTELL